MSRIPDRTAYPEVRGRPSCPLTAAVRRPAPGRSWRWIACLAALALAASGAQAQNVFPAQAVGSTSGEQSIQVTSPNGGTVQTVEVLTLGASGKDFAAGLGASTCPGASLSANGKCTQWVTFTPAAPGLRMGAVVLLDSSNNVLGTAYLLGAGSGGLGVLAPGNLLPVAGQDGLYTAVDDGKLATSAELYLPTSVAVDGNGNIYIADSAHNRIRMVCSKNPPAFVTTCNGAGYITTIAGNGNPAYTGDGGAAASATLNTPSGVALDGAGNLYIADTGNNVIRVITAATGVISTIAGNSAETVCAGKTDPVGDGCPATQATLNQPNGVTLDGAGNLYIADTYNQRIREAAASTGIITTIAGDGYTNANGTGGYTGDGGLATAAELNYPYAVAFDPSGNMYIPDSANNRIREVVAVGGVITSASTITTFAGNGTAGYTGDGGAAASAELYSPSGVAVDAAGNVYIADTQNAAIRKVNAATGDISTLAVNGKGDYYSNGAFVKPEALYGPIGLLWDGGGNLYVADTLDMVVREIEGNFIALDYTTAVRQGSKSTPIDQTIENDGNVPLDLTAITPDANSAVDASTTCNTNTPYLGVASDCTIAAVFAPTVSGNPLDANIDVAEDAQPGSPGVVAPNSPLDILLVGDALAVNSTTTVVTSTPNPSGFGQSVTFTVTVTTGAGTGNLTGTVSITDTFNGATATLASGLTLTLNSAGDTGTATFAISTLAAGSHTIVASYNNANDPAHFSSKSTDNGVAPLIQTVEEGTVTTLSSSANPSAVGQNVTFKATVAANSAGGGVTPDGTVTFSWGTTAQTETLNAGQATYSTAALPSGLTTITASYSGDTANDILGSEGTLSQDVQASDTIAVTSTLNPSNYGQPVTFTATISSTATQAATGTVDFLDNGKSIGTGTLSGNPAAATFTTSSLVVGTHPITVSYAGDSYNAAATSLPPLSQVVNETQTATTISAAPAPGIAGTPETITATVKVIAGAATVTGTVTFTSGTTTLGTANLNTATETAAIQPVLAPGTYQIVATYSGDSNDQGSASAPQALTVNQATTETTVSASPNPALVLQAVTFTAKVTGNGATPTGTVTFMEGTTTLGTATLSGGAASYTDTAGLAAGSYQITAVYSGDADNAASTSSSYALTVGAIPTTTDLGSTTSSGSNPQVILVATVLNGAAGPKPTGTVTFKSGSTTLGSATLDANGVATLTPNLNAGTNYTITASYSGDPDHSPSTSQPINISGTATGFNLTVTPAAVTMATQQNATVTVTLTSNGSFTDTIGLGCASLPNGVNCHFSSPSVKLPANGTAQAQLTIDTNNPLGGGSTAMNRRSGGSITLTPSGGELVRVGPDLAGLFLPFGAFFGWLFWRLRRRSAGFLTMVLALALTAGAMLASGCSGFSMGSAAPGNYTIQVTGTGENSNVIHYQNVSLTITQ